MCPVHFAHYLGKVYQVSPIVSGLWIECGEEIIMAFIPLSSVALPKADLFKG